MSVLIRLRGIARSTARHPRDLVVCFRSVLERKGKPALESEWSSRFELELDSQAELGARPRVSIDTSSPDLSVIGATRIVGRWLDVRDDPRAGSFLYEDIVEREEVTLVAARIVDGEPVEIHGVVMEPTQAATPSPSAATAVLALVIATGANASADLDAVLARLDP